MHFCIIFAYADIRTDRRRISFVSVRNKRPFAISGTNRPMFTMQKRISKKRETEDKIFFNANMHHLRWLQEYVKKLTINTGILRKWHILCFRGSTRRTDASQPRQTNTRSVTHVSDHVRMQISPGTASSR